MEHGSFSWHTDMPVPLGGTNEALSPTALLLSALAGCAVVFIPDTLAPQLGVNGPLAASDVVREITGAERINPVGYCIGGTLLAMTLAYLAARRDDRFGAATFMVSLLDFSESATRRCSLTSRRSPTEGFGLALAGSKSTDFGVIGDAPSQMRRSAERR